MKKNIIKKIGIKETKLLNFGEKIIENHITKIPINHIIKIEDLAFKSPGGGLKPYLYKSLINKKTKKIIKIDEKIRLSDLK
jgi:sialic acid synthase SpsE